MKVIFTKSPSGAPHKLGYSEGDVADLPQEQAEALIAEDIAVSHADTVKQQGADAGAAVGQKSKAAPASEKATKKTKVETATKK